MASAFVRPRVSAVLGPTNTGKTYLAIERMLGHASGMIGFPLRLLARENYDRVCRLRGAAAAALITGEERIVPPNPRYFLCTVEAMPLERRVDFLAVDEIQLCGDAERGHVFTDRLLHARGDEETMFLGAQTIAPLVRRLVSDADFVRRPRFSVLSYVGSRKLSRLPPRSAVIAFSAARVYELAELVRRQRGGTAVVLGALSPRTRNAQVAMYEAGEVDYLVATDAIGMGLNMAIDHVAFSALSKFDGRSPRHLSPAEIGQIAGRAGRHMSNGTFGATAELGPMDPQLVERLEEHRFDNLNMVFWRNPDLAFGSLEALRDSLAASPPSPELVRAREADDFHALLALMDDRDVRDRATNPAAVRLLWEVCQIPDYQKDMSGGHPRLVKRIYQFLTSGDEVIPTDWIAHAVDRLDRVDGGIDTLVSRIAHTRTWTYVSHRSGWLGDAEHWRERARTLEDKLSDALHDRLTQRFVDRRAAQLVRRVRSGDELMAAVTHAGDVVVEGEAVGRIEGFRFVPHATADGDAAPVLAAANRVMREDVGPRIAACMAALDEAFAMDRRARIIWREAPVARLAPGPALLRPVVEVLSSELLDASHREQLRRRLSSWLDGHARAVLAPLFALSEAPLSGPARGVAYQLVEALGAVRRRQVEAQLRALHPADRRSLARLGVRIGTETVFIPALLKPGAVELKSILWPVGVDRAPAVDAPAPGRTSLPRDANWPEAYYLALGYRVAGDIAVRVDLLERLLAELRRLARAGPQVLANGAASAIGASPEALVEVMRAFGFRARTNDGGIVLEGREAPVRRRTRTSGKSATRRAADDDSPFARLRDLGLAD
ncbi:MAG: helicase-related protein [Alphaproteobacteria bacterium]